MNNAELIAFFTKNIIEEEVKMLKKIFNVFAACFLGTFGVCLGLVAGNKVVEKFCSDEQEFNGDNSTEEE